ncbi:MAG: aspartyl protease family protein [Thermodesulfobacteriota bacterium]
MIFKNFENTIRFIQGPQQDAPWFPIVQVTLITPQGKRIDLPLLFDTGANITTLSHQLYQMFGLQSWNQGTPVTIGTAGGLKTAYRYTVSFELFNKVIDTPILLVDTLSIHPLYCGVIGRDTFFAEFGFGFWENQHELYVTANP